MNDKASFEDLEFMLKIIGETLEVDALTKEDMFQTQTSHMNNVDRTLKIL